MKLTVNLIKERLNKAIPGKWKTEITNMEEPGYEQFTKKIDIVKKEGKTTYVIARMDWSSPPRDTAEFIAHAPEDMRFLLDTIEALQQENERIRGCYEVTNDHWKRLATENEIFREDITDANIQMAYRDKIIGKQREALKVAREVFKTLSYISEIGYDNHRWIDEALATIAEVVGE